MRRIFLCGAFVLVLCGCSVNRNFVTAVDEAWDVIGPRYVEYIKADPKLDDESKITRLRTAALLTDLINEAQQ